MRRALTRYAFDELKLKWMEIRCAEQNARSRAIPERLGFAERNTIMNAEWLYDHFVDHVVYRMDAADEAKLGAVKR